METLDYRQRIAELLSGVLAAQDVKMEPAELRALIEIPRDAKMGDLAFPCFRFAKALRQAPPKIAASLVEAVKEAGGSESPFSSIEAAGPYLNFTIDKGQLAASVIPQIISGDFLARRADRSERVMIEYSQPNTHKPFHVGHTRNVALGDALVRICEWAGYEVVAANYIGDVGAHIAKCLWVYRQDLDRTIPAENRGEFLGAMYTRATELLDFTTLTATPIPGVVTAKVKSIEAHPENEKWKVVGIDAGGGAHKSVVCGGQGYAVGDTVAYATVGSRVAGREVTLADKKGVTSEGMICSEHELGLGSDRQKIHVLEDGTPLGEEIAEVLRHPKALPAGRSVLEEMRERDSGVRAILQALESGEEEITALWQETRQWSLDEFAEIYEWLGARFDHDFYESDVADSGKAIVKEYLDKGVFVRSEGAVGVELSEYKLPFFLVLKSDGTGLYSTKDLSLAQLKFEKFGVDRSVYVVAEEQALHFQQVFKTLELMGYERAKKCFHLSYGMVVLPDGKMSSRKGNVILFSQLRQRLVSKIRTAYLDEKKSEGWSEEEIAEGARHVAIATIRYGMLNTDAKKDIVFDLDEWTARSGNTGPYLMYAYTRTRSILRKVGELAADPEWSLLTHETEQDLLRRLLSFPDVCTRAALDYQPQLICLYLYDLCRDLSKMYDKCSVVKAESEPLKAARAGLVDATGRVIGKGLELLGISPLERM